MYAPQATALWNGNYYNGKEAIFQHLTTLTPGKYTIDSYDSQPITGGGEGLHRRLTRSLRGDALHHHRDRPLPRQRVDRARVLPPVCHLDAGPVLDDPVGELPAVALTD